MTTISVSRSGETAVVTFRTPILARDVLQEITLAFDRLAAQPSPTPVVLTSAHPTIFLAGAHLGEIAELDVVSCQSYANLGRSVAAGIASHPAPVVAAVHGSCSGGGFDLVLACDAIVASADATFSHPGVMRGLVTGWGGTTSVPRLLGRPAARRAFIGGASIDAHSMKETGIFLEIAADTKDAACRFAGRLHSLHPSRLPLWRHLKGPRFIDRFRALVVEKS